MFSLNYAHSRELPTSGMVFIYKKKWAAEFLQPTVENCVSVHRYTAGRKEMKKDGNMPVSRFRIL